MVIVLEGPDGTGKSSVARLLSDKLPLSNLIKLSGAPKEVTSAEWMQEVYWEFCHFLVLMGNRAHVILDRFAPSEFVYSPIFKGYDASYTLQFMGMLHDHVNIHYFYLTASIDTVLARIVKKSKVQDNEKHPDKTTLEHIRDGYDRWFEWGSALYPACYHKIETDDKDIAQVAQTILDVLGIAPKEVDTTYSEVRS